MGVPPLWKGKTTHFGCPKFQSTLTNPFQIVNIAWSLVRPQFFIFAEDWGRISPGREDVKRSELDKKQQAVEKLFHYVILSEAKNLTQGVILNPSIALRVNSVKDLMSSFALLRTGFVASGSSE
jgi:DNA phosphorothioation-dependent restriction protein DptG